MQLSDQRSDVQLLTPAKTHAAHFLLTALGVPSKKDRTTEILP